MIVDKQNKQLTQIFLNKNLTVQAKELLKTFMKFLQPSQQ